MFFIVRKIYSFVQKGGIMLFKSQKAKACGTFKIWGIPITVGVFGI